jgi:hypothetical protein
MLKHRYGLNRNPKRRGRNVCETGLQPAHVLDGKQNRSGNTAAVKSIGGDHPILNNTLKRNKVGEISEAEDERDRRRKPSCSRPRIPSTCEQTRALAGGRTSSFFSFSSVYFLTTWPSSTSICFLQTHRIAFSTLLARGSLKDEAHLALLLSLSPWLVPNLFRHEGAGFVCNDDEYHNILRPSIHILQNPMTLVFLAKNPERQEEPASETTKPSAFQRHAPISGKWRTSFLCLPSYAASLSYCENQTLAKTYKSHGQSKEFRLTFERGVKHRMRLTAAH